MFRLPVCPYCGTVFRYRETFAILRRNLFRNQKTQQNPCYHCEEDYRVSLLPGVPVLVLLWAAVSILTNLLMLSRMTRLNLIVMFIMTIVYMAFAILMLPFFITFKKREEKKIV